MKILFTGDWQLDFMNLDKAKVMIKEVFKICKDYKVDAVVNLGDVKQHYNPIDVRVANYGVKICTEFKKAGIPFFVLLGNHDRVGMYDDKQSWLPILEEAGALVYSESISAILYDNTQLHFLPFMTDKQKLKEAAKELAHEADPETSILVFHEDVKGCRYNLLTKSEGKITTSDLCSKRYMFCIGGHIHFQHRVAGNVWYAGSPFATDWGEANQIKGYLIVDTKTRKMIQVPSEQPGLYDPLWPDWDKVKRKDWAGAEVRIHVPYDHSVKDIMSLMQKAKARAQQDYPGAQIVTVTEHISEDKNKTFLDEDSSDAEHLEEYVKQTCWDHLNTDRERVLTYLTERLKEVGIRARHNRRIDFIRAKGYNFLSYERIELDYTKKGITLLLGENRDWGKRSNGAGKTGSLQLPAVAMFGETFKGQKHNAWARRGSVSKAFVIFEVKTQDNNRYKITRVRRPHKLKLQVWNQDKWHDISTGNKPGGTEALIEEKLGVTWQMLSNAIYVDCSRTNLLLSGRDSERKKLLEEFQNLERYAKAQEKVKQDLKKLKESMESLDVDLVEIATSIENHQETMQGIDTKGMKQAEKDYQAAKNKVEDAEEVLERFTEKHNEQFKKLQKQKNDLQEEINTVSEKIGELQGRANTGMSALAKIQKLERTPNGKCPVCEQEIPPNAFKKHKKELQNEIEELAEKIEGWETTRDGYRELVVVKNEEIENLRDAAVKNQQAIVTLKRERDQKKYAFETFKNLEGLKQDLESKINQCKKRKRIVEEDLQNHKQDEVFFEYCIEAFSRKGLPAFLNGLLCPRLNKAAQYYSKLFADSQIQVEFITDKDGEFDVMVRNAWGGENIGDQSQGETKMASLITSFALTGIAVTSNILILDEPGEGLDSVNARKFAQGLQKIAPRFGGIHLTTHNPAILSELSGERELRIVKENGISRIES